MRSMLRTWVASACVAWGACDTVRAWVQLDGTMSFDALIKDRATYLTNLVGGLKKAAGDVDFGYSVFGDRQTGGASETCYYDVGDFGGGTTVINAFFGGFKSVTDGDAPEDALTASAYIAGNKFPDQSDTLKVLITVTDAISKSEGEGGDLEGTNDIDDPTVCITCDPAAKLPSKDVVVNALRSRGIVNIILTTKEASDYWKSIAKATGRGAVLLTTADGAKDAAKILGGLGDFSCGGGGGGGTKKKGGKGKTIAIALVCTLLILAGLLGAGYWYWQRRQGAVSAPAAPAKPAAAARAKPAARAEEEEKGDEEEWDEEEYEDEGDWDEEEEEEV